MNDRIQRLIYRSKHRGNKENDILLGQYASQLHKLNDDDLSIYEDLLNKDDLEIYNWICGISTPHDKYLKTVCAIRENTIQRYNI